jgi:cobalamin biosynthesis protein CobT
VPFEIVGFRTIGGNRFNNTASEQQKKTISKLQDEKKIHRYDSIEMSYFKPFDTRYQMCLPTIGNMQSGGSNCDSESILYASESLLKRPERKKVMMVLSDGQPAFGYNNCSEAAIRKHTKETVKNIEKKGVHVIGIGIASDAVKSFYTNNIVVNDIKELPKEILKQLTTAIG